MLRRGRFTPIILFFLGVLLLTSGAQAQVPPLNSQPPATLVRLVFSNHSVGEAWLTDEVCNLRQALNPNRYYVPSSNYGGDPESPELD